MAEPKKSTRRKDGKRRKSGQSRPFIDHLTSIYVRNFKSIDKSSGIAIRPLTILAGANSSGKSSIMQPLLLLKQTIESVFDPGALLIDGPNVKFSSLDQIVSKQAGDKKFFSFAVASRTKSAIFWFTKGDSGVVDLVEADYVLKDKTVTLKPDMSETEIDLALAAISPEMHQFLIEGPIRKHIRTRRNRCFVEFVMDFSTFANMEFSTTMYSPLDFVSEMARNIIHIPGLRGNPERNYSVSALSKTFPGAFQSYLASIIFKWQKSNDSRLRKLGSNLERMGLSWGVVAKPISDTQVELQVGRLPKAAKGEEADLVNIADVGFGVSQVLPLLVALEVANPGQLIYIEQPEIHLHPRAQYALSEILAEATRCGVRLVIETHSSIMLLAFQSLTAEGKIDSDQVKLHWFSRDSKGTTVVESGGMDATGAFGDWPEDFGSVYLEAESRYINAVEKSLGVVETHDEKN